MLIPVTVLLTYCSSSKMSGTKSTAGLKTAQERFNAVGSDSAGVATSDTVIVTGSEFIPILGKSETGMRADLEGTWVLSSMPQDNGGLQNENNISGEKGMQQGHMGVKRDTTVITNNGGETSTTVYMMNKDTTKKITPAQGANMHEAEKPSLSFFGSNETFSGFTGCNKIAGRYQITGNNAISFQHSAPSTRMVCIGQYNEAAFLNTLKRVNAFKSQNGQLQFMEGDTVLFVFSRK
jgi:heat shock protein HslJ